MEHVYFDHNASAPLLEPVRQAMLAWLGGSLPGSYGNASSRHEYGRLARIAVETARQQVAAAVGAHPTEVVFTSGGSEANNLFLKGAAGVLKPSLLAVSAIEHPCVLEPAKQLSRQGWQVQTLPVDESGRVNVTAFEAQMAALPRQALVSVMSANNETGVVQDVAGLAARARRAKPWFHTDAVQSLGKLPLDFRALNAAGVQAMSLSAHKIGGPQGAGALILDKRVELAPLIAGGGQEKGLRSGTENIAALVGFGLACELAVAGLLDNVSRLESLRRRLIQGLAAVPELVFFAADAPHLPNTLFFAVPGIEGDTLVAHLDKAGFAAASGSACSSSSPEPSHVLLAMGVRPDLARCAIRVSLGRQNTERQADRFVAVFHDTVGRLKHLTAMAV